MRTIADRTLSWSIWCYRRLLRAYPRSFLVEYEDLLCQAFADLAHRAVRTKGIRGLIVLWMRTLPDLISSAFSQRLLSRSDWRFRLRWVLACTAGGLTGAICLFGWHLIAREIQALILAHPDSWPELIRLSRFSFQAGLTFLGLALGFFQSRALGWTRRRRAVWMFATFSGVMGSVGTAFIVPYFANYLQVTIHPWRLLLDHHPTLYYGGGAVLCVSLLGVFQAFLLARRNWRGILWIPASTVGIIGCAGIVAVSRFEILHFPFMFYLFFGLIFGLTYGVLTALPLHWILQSELAQEILSKTAPD